MYNFSKPVYKSSKALSSNNTYDDPRFLDFIQQKEREAKMANSLREEF